MKPASVLRFGLLFALLGTAAAGEPPHWDYSGKHGPEHWSELAPEYAACDDARQSPIDLHASADVALPPLEIAYLPNGQALWNNGHTVQVDFAAGSALVLDGVRFALKQLHFHAPSENRIDGKAYPMEAHLVHADAEGHLAVIAVMLEEGVENAALAALWPSIPETDDATVALGAPFSAMTLLPANRDYFRFDGSLTTPPCTEGVRWLVLKAVAQASHAQIERFRQVMHHANNRPLQPANSREVLE